MIPGALRARVQAWIDDDPDPSDQAELRSLLAVAAGADGDSGAAVSELADRFAGRLAFGTAGLRGAVGAGPNRMNRAVVRCTTFALAGWLREHDPAAAGRGVVIGCDARHRSDAFAQEAARVLAGAGLRVHLLPPHQPTPLLAFAVRHLGAAAGVMITASHNPPADNGYKLYTADGAQIIPPADTEIETAITDGGPASGIALAGPGDPLINRLGPEITQAYLAAIAAVLPTPGAAPALGVVYTPLHGVAAGLATQAIREAGLPVPVLVAAQAEPDPDFPTVPFPNPEVPGALDLALALARESDADLVLANDPDGDRLAVAAPDPAVAGGWRVLTGDQVGGLLGAYLLERTDGGPDSGRRLVATTVVSSTLLSKIAAAAGVRYAETLTGFKWIARAADRVPGARFLFGYEEALGYAIGGAVRDKDGISAAVALLSLAAAARAGGRSLLDRWDALEQAHGVHQTRQVTLGTRDTAAVMARLRAQPPSVLAGQPVAAITDLAAPGSGTGLPPSDVLSYQLAGGRVVIRPSGTEPKLKCYLEVVEPVGSAGLAAARTGAAARLAPLAGAVAALIT